MALVLTSHCPPPPPAAKSATDVPLRVLTWSALGTRCEVQYAATSAAQAQSFETAAVAWVAAFEAKYSRFLPDSLISRINAAAGRAPVAIDAEMEGLLALCDRVHFMTQGVLDPTALPLLRLWDYKAPSPRLPTDVELAAAQRLVGWKKVQRTPGHVFLPEPGMALDFGGFGKEWAVDIVAQIARDHGLTAALVDLGTTSAPLDSRPVAPRGTSGSKTLPPPARSKVRSRSPAAKASLPLAITCAASSSMAFATATSSTRARAAPSPTAAAKPPSSRRLASKLASSARPRSSSA